MGLLSFAKKMFSSQGRPQNCMLLTEYGEILDLSLDVKKGYVVREQKEQIYEAWGLDIGNQVKDMAYGYMQVISERDTAPLPLWGSHIRNYTKALLHTIAEAAADLQLLIIHKKAMSDRTWTFVTLIGVILGIVLILIVGTPMFQQVVLHRGG